MSIEQLVIPPFESYGEVLHTVRNGFSPVLTDEELKNRGVKILQTNSPDTNPKVSVIFCARNESEWLKKALDSLYSAKTNIDYECIVYDDNSTDECAFNIQVHRLLNSKVEAVGPSRARNWGAMLSRGEILIFCDGHLKFEDWWIENLIKPIEEDTCDVVNPIISDIAIPETKGYGWGFDTTSYEYKWDTPCSKFTYRAGMAGGCFAIKKEVFMNIGMFDKSFTKWGMEDSELALRLSLGGYRIGIEPKVDVGHFFKELNEYGVDWFSYNYNFLRMAYVNMDKEGYDYVFFNRIPGNTEEKDKFRAIVEDTSKFRRLQVERIKKVSFRDYLEKFARKMS